MSILDAPFFDTKCVSLMVCPTLFISLLTTREQNRCEITNVSDYPCLKVNNRKSKILGNHCKENRKPLQRAQESQDKVNFGSDVHHGNIRQSTVEIGAIRLDSAK